MSYSTSKPDMTPLDGQYNLAKRTEHPLKPAHPYGALRFEIKGKCQLRRQMDGALAIGYFALEFDITGTIRSHISIPIDPDYGDCIGNVINSLQVYDIDNWSDKSILDQLNMLLRGIDIDYTDTYNRRHQWSVLVKPNDITSNVPVAEFAK